MKILFYILMVCMVAYFDYSFKRLLKSEYKKIIIHTDNTPALFSEEMAINLPVPVRNWLKNSGAIGKPIIQSAHIRQNKL